MVSVYQSSIQHTGNCFQRLCAIVITNNWPVIPYTLRETAYFNLVFRALSFSYFSSIHVKITNHIKGNHPRIISRALPWSNGSVESHITTRVRISAWSYLKGVSSLTLLRYLRRARPIQPTMCTKVAVKYQSSSIRVSTLFNVIIIIIIV